MRLYPVVSWSRIVQGAVRLLDLLEALLLEDVHRGAVVGHGQAQTASTLLLRELDQCVEQL